MAAPVPPEGRQKQYVELPGKVYGEQYLTTEPLPIGAIVEIPPLYPASGGPYAVTTHGVIPLIHTDWVLSNRYSGQQIEVLSDVEFRERYSGPPAQGVIT